MTEKPKNSRPGGRGRTPKRDWDAIRRDFCGTILPLATIAEKHGLRSDRIRQYARQHDWERPEGAPADTPKPHPRDTQYGSSGSWGTGQSQGPARGGKNPRMFAAGSPVAVRKQGGEAGRGVPPTEKSVARQVQFDELIGMLLDIARNQAMQANARVAALNSAISHMFGAPVARNINFDGDDLSKLSEGELRERLAKLAG